MSYFLSAALAVVAIAAALGAAFFAGVLTLRLVEAHDRGLERVRRAAKP